MKDKKEANIIHQTGPDFKNFIKGLESFVAGREPGEGPGAAKAGFSENKENQKVKDIFETIFSPEEIKDSINDNQMIVSIMAGVDIETLQRELLHKKIVRAMPNTPAQISEGMTVWTSTKEIKENEKDKVKKIFSSMGKELYFEEEQYVDMATALTGTGPAYVFLFLEAMIAAGVHLGFSRRDARELVYQTTLGSVLFAINSEKHTSELRDMVTSPGGTSADALYEMEKGSFRTIIEKAVYSAFKRTIYLKEIVKKKGGSNVS